MPDTRVLRAFAFGQQCVDMLNDAFGYSAPAEFGQRITARDAARRQIASVRDVLSDRARNAPGRRVCITPIIMSPNRRNGVSAGPPSPREARIGSQTIVLTAKDQTQSVNHRPTTDHGHRSPAKRNVFGREQRVNVVVVGHQTLVHERQRRRRLERAARLGNS